MNYSVTFPTAKNSYSRKTNSYVVRRVLRKIGPGQAFGYEEIVLQKPHRVFRARVIGDKPAVIVQSSKENFTETVGVEDIKKYRDSVVNYSDFQKEGLDLVHEMDSYKHMIDTFEDASGQNLPSMPNFRSQSTIYSWLGENNFGLKA